MATKKKSIAKKIPKEGAEQVTLSVEPGTKLTITLDIGETVVDGKVPLIVSIEQVRPEPLTVEERTAPQAQPEADTLTPVASVVKSTPQWGRFEALKGRLGVYDLATWLFIFAIAVYLLTRLIGLTQFPIYFFTDEAIQSLSVIDLIENEYRDPRGVWFPTYFRNGDYYNIGLSVYLQWLPAVFFGKSAVATRAMSALVTLIAAIAVGLVLRDIFKLKYWWTGTLFLSITPAWFLHSRTAFETAEFVALFAGTLCAYLYYRYKSPGFLNFTVFMGALAFYTYSPGQVIVPLTALGLLISDWRYHWENRRTVLIGLAFAVVLAVPYIRYIINNPSTPFAHLHTLWSYWYENIPFSEKLVRYLSEFGVGLSPWYWYVSNNRDLARHLMKGYGNILIATSPFAVLGLIHTLRNLRNSAHRVILLALLISPAAAALVQISITRTLVFVIPVAILTAMGLEQVLGWLEDPKKHLAELSEGAGPSAKRLIAALIVVLAGIPIALVSTENINRFILLSLTFILGIQVSGVLERWARSLTRAEAAPPKLWKFSHTFIALAAFALLAGANIRMLNDAIRNGPLWYRDYGLGGMQYGAFQIFNIIDEYLNDHPDAKIIFSPDWANGADVLARFFLDNPSSIRIGSVQGHITQLSPLDDNTLFIMTPQEYNIIKENPKFAEIDVETIIPYPDDSPGFYFVRLRYVDNIDEIFAAEQSVRQALQESTLTIDGQDVKLRHSYLDSEDQAKWIALVFDNDPFTVTKTLETNPFVLEMTFPETRTINGFSIIIGSANVQITLKGYAMQDAEPLVYTFEGQGAQNQPELSFNLPEAVQVQVLRFEVLDLHSSDRAKVHIWELKLR